jgi:hypothetical protein
MASQRRESFWNQRAWAVQADRVLRLRMSRVRLSDKTTLTLHVDSSRSSGLHQCNASDGAAQSSRDLTEQAALTAAARPCTVKVSRHETRLDQHYRRLLRTHGM